MFKELRQQLYAMMSEATDEIERHTPEQCEALLGTNVWKAYKIEERAAGNATNAATLDAHLKRMRFLLDQIIASI